MKSDRARTQFKPPRLSDGAGLMQVPPPDESDGGRAASPAPALAPPVPAHAPEMDADAVKTSSSPDTNVNDTAAPAALPVECASAVALADAPGDCSPDEAEAKGATKEAEEEAEPAGPPAAKKARGDASEAEQVSWSGGERVLLLFFPLFSYPTVSERAPPPERVPAPHRHAEQSHGDAGGRAGGFC